MSTTLYSRPAHIGSLLWFSEFSTSFKRSKANHNFFQPFKRSTTDEKPRKIIDFKTVSFRAISLSLRIVSSEKFSHKFSTTYPNVFKFVKTFLHRWTSKRGEEINIAWKGLQKKSFLENISTTRNCMTWIARKFFITSFFFPLIHRWSQWTQKPKFKWHRTIIQRRQPATMAINNRHRISQQILVNYVLDVASTFRIDFYYVHSICYGMRIV